MAKMVENMSQNKNGHNNQSPSCSSNSWNDQKDKIRNARKAFAKKTFSEKLCENWEGYRESILKTYNEREMDCNENVAIFEKLSLDTPSTTSKTK